MKRRFVLAVTGASGATYAIRLLEVLLAAGCDVHLTISSAAQSVIKQENNLNVDLEHFDPATLLLGAWRTRRQTRAGPCPGGNLHGVEQRALGGYWRTGGPLLPSLP